MAMENLATFISEAKKRKYSLVPGLSENDISKIWEAASRFIRSLMLHHKGVVVSGLGTFTFSESRILVRGRPLVIHRPVFILSESFVQSHGISRTKRHTPGTIPVIPLNYTVLSNETAFSRDTVELCIKEILLAMSQCLFNQKNIQLDFGGIGRLFIRDKKVKMKFHLGFIGHLDSSGELERVFRPFTAMSEMSIMSPSTLPVTRLSTALPKIDESSSCVQPCRITTADYSVIQDATTDGIASNKTMGNIMKNEEKSRSLSAIPTATLVSSLDQNAMGNSAPVKLEHIHNPSEQASKPATGRSEPDLCYVCAQRERRNVYVDLTSEKRKKEQRYDQVLWDYQRRRNYIAKLKEQAAKQEAIQYAKQQASFNLDTAIEKTPIRHHHNAFHPSYLLDQRPITPPKQPKQSEYCMQLQKQIKMLQEYLTETEEKKEKAEQEFQKDLAESLAVLQATYSKEKAEEVAKYHKALAEQMAVKQDLQSRDIFVLSALRFQHSPLSIPYHTAITPCITTPDEMVKAKYDKARVSEASTTRQFPVFAVEKDLKEKRESAKKDQLDQLADVASRRSRIQQKVVEDKLQEAEMMKRTKEGLAAEFWAARRHSIMQRKRLEQAWDATIDKKQKRLLQEMRSSNKEPGIVLLQQCEKYKRCHQCQRRKHSDVTKIITSEHLKSGPNKIVA